MDNLGLALLRQMMSEVEVGQAGAVAEVHRQLDGRHAEDRPDQRRHRRVVSAQPSSSLKLGEPP